MRTTLNLDPDAFQAAKGLAARDRKPIGKVVSELILASLAVPRDVRTTRTGIPLLPVDPKSGVVTNELINRIRDEM
jgi:hypothetical protein